MTNPLTLENALNALTSQGCAPTPEHPTYTCPNCKTADLTITTNGNGPQITCNGTCTPATVHGYLETILNLPGGRPPRGPTIDPLNVLRVELNLPELTKIVKHGRTGAAYNLHLNDGRIVNIGSIATISTQAKFRQMFLPQVRRNPKRHKPADWDNIVEQIEQAAEERDAVASLADETLSWIAASITSGPLKRNVNTDNSAEMFALLDPATGGRPPFIDQAGRLHIRLEHIVQWLSRMASLKVTQPELSARLSELDFERVQTSARKGDNTHKARYWRSPPNFEDRL